MLVQDPSIGRALQRSLRLTSLPDSLLAPEIVPVILVSDLSEGTPFGDVERSAAGFATIGAVAAENGHISLRRPGAGIEVIIKKLTFDIGSPAARIVFGTIGAAIPGGTTASPETAWQDFNIAGKPSAVLEQGTVLNAALPAIDIMWEWIIPANTTRSMNVNIRLGVPGTVRETFWTHCATVNQTHRMGMEWIERPPLG